ncbi:MAG: hypothetical protein WBR21_08135, partial [Rouxiella badensis]|uniref:hypothetical protein n=1 Tax=Rouxiella badensis TaxID=1646377 RepID=UPI003C48BF06
NKSMEAVQGWHFDHGRHRSSIALDETDLARILTNAGIPLARLKDMPEATAYQLLLTSATIFNGHSHLKFLARQGGFDATNPAIQDLRGEIEEAKTERAALLEQLREFKPKARPRNGGGKTAAETDGEKETAAQ